MHLFPPEVQVDDDEGFDKQDLFERKEFGEGLGNLFANVEDPMVAILDAPWGSGKTTFIKMWCGHMRNRGFPVIYFDAFKNDYTDDAFLAIAGEVIALADELGQKDKEATGSYVEKAIRVGEIVGKGALKNWAGKYIGTEGVQEALTALTKKTDKENDEESCNRYLLDKLKGRKWSCPR